MPAKNVNGTSIHYQESGKGTPLVLLHGFPLDSRVWKAQLEELSQRCRVIAPDLRGFGQSTSDDPFTMESIADDIHALLTELDALPAVVGGLSMGGYAALAYAKKFPTDLAGLLLIDTRAEADTPEARDAREKMIDLVRRQESTAVANAMMPKMLAAETSSRSPEIAEELRAIMEAQTPRAIENALVAMRSRPDCRDDLPSIAVPTLILVGESDAITPVAMAETLHRGIPQSRLLKIPSAGHMTPMEQPAEVNRAIGDFVESLRK